MSKSKYRIIKVVLSGDVRHAITDGMEPPEYPQFKVNGLPAYCGSIATWDGKFHS